MGREVGFHRQDTDSNLSLNNQTRPTTLTTSVQNA
jgi:hypothetical protein